MAHGYMGRVLEVDLTKRRCRDIVLPEEVLEKYLGGSGLNSYILYSEPGGPADPLGPNSPLVFSTGPLTGTMVPTSSRFAVSARSPQTGLWGESDCGGSWGSELKRTGYDAVVVRGKSDLPAYLYVTEGGVEFRDASALWGMDSFQTHDAVRDATADSASVLCIGPSGEKMVKMSAVMAEGRDARAAGRTGMGAVMGSKKLKAIAVKGGLNVDVAGAAGLARSVRELVPMIVDKAKGMHEYGTSGGTSAHDQIGNLPLRNWAGSSWPEGAARISGIQMVERGLLTKRYACRGCVIGCGRVVQIHSGPYAMAEAAGPEYETIAMLGSLLLVDDLEAICFANDLCNRFGLDTISTGAAIAFATEAFERGIVSESETEGIHLAWGSASAMVEMVRQIGEARGLGKLLGEGVVAASRTLGRQTEQFTVHVKGLEAPAHDPRACFGNALAYATANRGACHLGALVQAFERFLSMPDWGQEGPVDRFDSESKPRLVFLTQNLMSLFDSLKVCKFLLFGNVKLHHLADWLSLVTGVERSGEELLVTGERIFNLRRLYNLRLGATASDDSLPWRFLREARTDGGAAGKLPPFEDMLPQYYLVRGWNHAGEPTEDLLQRLGLPASV